MRLTASIMKTWKENVRDWKVLSMVLLFSPFFLLLMWLFYGTESTVYKVGLVDLDRTQTSSNLFKRLAGTIGQDGKPLYRITVLKEEALLKSAVKDKSVDIGIVIPEGYSAKLVKAGREGTGGPAMVEFYGSMGNGRYMIAAIMASDAVSRQGIEVARITLPSGIRETFLEKKLPVNEFESFVPGLISMAILMVLFSATGSIVKENDKKTLIRLKLSRLGAFHFLAGISIVQAAIAVTALVLTYWTALGFGYRPVGGFGPVLVVGVFSSLSMVAVSLLVAAFLDTVFDVLTIGCFPFFILMFFSGAAFPLPEVNLFAIAGRSFAVNDVLPLTHTANAFSKILNYGEGLGGVTFEIAMICLLTILYFSAGLVLYRRRKLSRA